MISLDRLRALAAQVQPLAEAGRLPSYVPWLTHCDADCFAAAGRAADGPGWAIGQTEQRFPLMSVMKPFLLRVLLESLGEAAVWARVDRQPSALPFNSLAQLQADGGRPRNAMLNSGAIALAELLPGHSAAAKTQALVEALSGATGLDLRLDETVLASVEAAPNPQNRAIAVALAAAGGVADPDLALATYNRLCCLSVTVGELAEIGRLLLAGRAGAIVQEVLVVCGLYEASADWWQRTHTPAKSGVSGALLALVPAGGVVAVYSPPLNAQGNSIAGLAFVEGLVQDLGATHEGLLQP